jgi:hypothetical protein
MLADKPKERTLYSLTPLLNSDKTKLYAKEPEIPVKEVGPMKSVKIVAPTPIFLSSMLV